MSSYSAWVCVDLLPGRTPAELFDKIRARPGFEREDTPLLARVDGNRVFILADFASQFAFDVVDLLTGLAARAIVAADFDEDGVQNRILGPDGQTVHAAEIAEEGGSLGASGQDTPASRRHAAALFAVDPAGLDEVSRTWAAEGSQPSVLGVPFLQWWDALDASWPDDYANGAIDLRAGIAGQPVD
jgi:hypothetical protein